MMPVRGLKFISEFLLPNLNSKRFGTRLMWLNIKYSIFQVQWCHKSAADWTSYDAEVFMEWDKIKGRDLTGDKERFTKSKQRFRAILYKLIKSNHITALCNDKYTKIYCLGTKDFIPNEVIERVLQSREGKEKSLERIYTCDPETVVDVGEMSFDSFVVNNPPLSIMEDHKYAYSLKEVTEENEGTVPDNQVEQFDSRDIPCMYINVWPLPNKHNAVLKLEDSSLEDFNGSNCPISSDDIRWGESSEIKLYGLPLNENTFEPESFLSSHDNNKKCITISESQSLPFSDVWNNSQL